MCGACGAAPFLSNTLSDRLAARPSDTRVSTCSFVSDCQELGAFAGIHKPVKLIVLNQYLLNVTSWHTPGPGRSMVRGKRILFMIFCIGTQGAHGAIPVPVCRRLLLLLLPSPPHRGALGRLLLLQSPGAWTIRRGAAQAHMVSITRLPSTT